MVKVGLGGASVIFHVLVFSPEILDPMGPLMMLALSFRAMADLGASMVKVLPPLARSCLIILSALVIHSSSNTSSKSASLSNLIVPLLRSSASIATLS